MGPRPTEEDDSDGAVVTLDEQDRRHWNTGMVVRGISLLNDSLVRTGQQADAYQLQAAIAAEHARAARSEDTDWTEVLRLYDLLVSVAPSSAAGLARAVAAAEALGPAVGLSLLAELQPDPRWHAVRAELLAREGRYDEAAPALTASLAGPSTQPEREYRERRLATFLELGAAGS